MHTPAIVETLRRHRDRRTQGVPTATALVGPVGAAVRAWGAAVGARACVVSGSEVLPAWVAAAFATEPPAARAGAALAAASGRPDAEIARMTRHDLDALRPTLPHTPAVAAALLVLGGADPAGVARELGPRAVRAVADLYPPDRWPAPLLTAPPGAGDDWALAAARALERIAVEEPRLPVGVALTADAYARLTAAHPDARAVALLREGFVEVVGVGRNELEGRLRAVGVEPPPGAADRLAAEGLAADVADAFVAAARAVADPSPGDVASDFRSVHEEFLFGALESLPPTAGLFRPNRPLEFRHGHQPAECDLVCSSLKLAVEVDGAFYHLNPDQYRRDRRKDWLYQRHGYLVLRFLADDVVRDLETVLDTILEAVALRRASAPPTGAA